MSSPFRWILLAAAGLYALSGVVPLVWTLGGALLERGSELREIALSAPAWAALGRSVGVGIGGAIVGLSMGAPLAFLTGRTNVPARRWLSGLALVPLALPPYNVALALGSWIPRTSVLATSLVLGLALYPIVFVFLRAAFASIDPSLEEAGLIARGKWVTLHRITWPLVRPWTVAASGIVFLLGLGEFGAPALLGLAVYPAWITRSFAATYDAAGAAVAALPLLGVVALLLALEYAAIRRTGAFAGRLRGAEPMNLGRARPAALALCASIVLASPGLPVISSLAQVDAQGLGQALGLAARPAWNTLLVASGGCLLATGAALAFALLTRRGFRMLRTIPLAFFVIPGAILGIGLIGFWNHPEMPPIYGTTFLLILAVALRYAVLAERALDAGLGDVPRAQEEVARLAGRGEVSITFRILLPQVRSAVAAGAIAFYLFALRDLDTVVTIYPPGSETLTVRLYSVLANSPRSLQASLSLLQMALSLPVVALLILALRRSRWLF